MKGEKVALGDTLEVFLKRAGEPEFTLHSTEDDLITTAGKTSAARLIGAIGSEAGYTYLAIGEGTLTASVGDTTLGTEITSEGGERAAATVSNSANILYVENTYNFTSSFAVTESGCFNDASVGTMLCRQVFGAINVQSGDSLLMRWKITVS